jgi:hypothetical protein
MSEPEPTEQDRMSSSEFVHDNGAQNLHLWFELSYAQYLTVPRSILAAMPDEWQGKMADLLRALDATFDWRPEEGRYWCRLRDDAGRFADDRLAEYRHPDRAFIESLRRPPPSPAPVPAPTAPRRGR